MTNLPYSLDPAPGYNEYKVSSMLREYLEILMEQPEDRERIQQILQLIDFYSDQLRKLKAINRTDTIKEVYLAIDRFFNSAHEENKKNIQCKAGCTACCFIEIDISREEAAFILNYCTENSIELEKEYLSQQAAVGRKSYSNLSKCVFLKENLCSIYPVRPIACRKHWVKTDPALCDFSKNLINQVGGYFDVNTEILASAMLNVGEVGPLEKILLQEIVLTETFKDNGNDLQTNFT